MTGQNEVLRRNHGRAIRFFWCFLIGATVVSLIGNIVHAVLPYISRVPVQVGAATVPPLALLAAVHGIALAVRAGASGRVYCWAVSAVASIGAGAFAVSFLALRDLMRVIGYNDATAWIFPAIIDTAVAVSTLMLVALGDKPARRSRNVVASSNTQTPTRRRSALPPTQSANDQVRLLAPPNSRAQAVQVERVQSPASVSLVLAHSVQDSAQTEVTQADADLAAELIASGVTTQTVETVIEVLAASRGGASINAAARASGINYRTAQRIIRAGADHGQPQLAVVS
ncbi:hypothetical protein A5712_29800 [Mycobacterium sp. E2327]|uniref:DUF2637 domain-containing protein n=1 Tax=Mycobacterium sp. E2327 TaxID=1834132 RepID=UPI0007FB8770|nr:DUF2637 domain-containing protein [Mycobacterium sp. E2327]OBI14921.1 hypothetical protein A5712_29800 [Mycobacterium sp. E2327]